MQQSHHVADPRIVLGLTAATSIGLIPFAIHHLLTHNWALVISVGGLCIWHGVCALYIWRHPDSQRAGPYVVFGSLAAVLWGVHRLGGMGIHWSYVLILGIYYLLPARRAGLANLMATPAAIILVAPHVSGAELARIAAGLTLVSVFAYVFSRQVERQRAELMRLATVDPLTQVRNRRAFADALEEAVYRYGRHATPASLIILDIDHFKRINDCYGHAVGDEVLVDIATRLRVRVRLTDALFRYGGEEFVVLTTQTGQDGARQLAEDLRSEVSGQPTRCGDRISISCGVAELRRDESRESWVKRADTALYLAKARGRDRVVVDGEDGATPA